MSDCLYYLLQQQGFTLNYRLYDMSYNRNFRKQLVQQHVQEYQDNKKASKMTPEEYQDYKVNDTLKHLESLGIKVKE